jgi:hypothetical protein
MAGLQYIYIYLYLGKEFPEKMLKKGIAGQPNQHI